MCSHRDILHNLPVSADHCQRCSQVMAHIRNQLTPQILHLPQLSGSIVQRIAQLLNFQISLTAEGNIILTGRKRFRSVVNGDDGTCNLS